MTAMLAGHRQAHEALPRGLAGLGFVPAEGGKGDEAEKGARGRKGDGGECHEVKD